MTFLGMKNFCQIMQKSSLSHLNVRVEFYFFDLIYLNYCLIQRELCKTKDTNLIVSCCIFKPGLCVYMCCCVNN